MFLCECNDLFEIRFEGDSIQWFIRIYWNLEFLYRFNLVLSGIECYSCSFIGFWVSCIHIGFSNRGTKRRLQLLRQKLYIIINYLRETLVFFYVHINASHNALRLLLVTLLNIRKHFAQVIWIAKHNTLSFFKLFDYG